jgi:isopentenyl diphosphate isomerase/L-lactate dehydrogenase-like FMN-dependent dehydrogenase
LVAGGFRRGTDIVKALSIGAAACLVGRPWLFGLAAGGEAGVTAMLEQLRSEIERTMQLLGVAELTDLGPELVRRRPGSGWEGPAETVAAPGRAGLDGSAMEGSR